MFRFMSITFALKSQDTHALFSLNAHPMLLAKLLKCLNSFIRTNRDTEIWRWQERALLCNIQNASTRRHRMLVLMDPPLRPKPSPPSSPSLPLFFCTACIIRYHQSTSSILMFTFIVWSVSVSYLLPFGSAAWSRTVFVILGAVMW